MEKENLKEKAYNIIKRNIVNCDYAPGSFLNEADLMKEIGASRTPIREALNKLEQENLIKIIAKRGVLVSEISIDEINSIYQTRELIEPYIIRLWGNKLDAGALKQYKDRLLNLSNSISEAESYKIDDEIHNLIVSACGNKYLTQVMNKCYDQNNRMRIISGKLKSRLQISHDEHLKILDSIINNNMEGAAKAMEYHLESAKKAAIESLFK